MAGTFTAINLSQIPAPAVVERLDYESILSAMVDDLRQRDPAFTAMVESDPAYKILEVAAFREMILRERINSASRAVMLPYAAGADLDNLVSLLNIQRLVIIPANNATIPPTPAVMESDEDLRRRALLAWESLSTAGPAGSYIFHALKADPNVKDASAISPQAGQVLVTVLSREGLGVASSELIETVEEALNSETIRPLTDQLIVQAATVQEYQINAVLFLYDGPDSAVVIENAIRAAVQYAQDSHKLGNDIIRSAIFAALHQAGVQRVELMSPADNIILDATEAAFCTNINVQFGGRDQ